MTDTPAVIASSERWAPVASLTDRFFDIPIWKVLVQHTPTTEPEMLEYLASELDLLDTAAWQNAQTDEERRSIIDKAHERHRTRGTDAGLKQAAAEAGGRVRRIVAPPNKFFLSQSATVAERNAWLSRHPEIRLYPRRVPGKKEVAMLGGDFVGACFPARSSALVRSRLRATLVQDGIETELETPSWEIASTKNEAITEVVIPGKRGHASFLSAGPIAFTAATNARLRRFVLRNVETYCQKQATLGLRTLTPSLTPIDIDGEMVSEIRTAPRLATFCGRVPRFTVSLRAELAQYRRIKLFDPTQPVVKARAASHLGYSRLAMPPHHAEVEVVFNGYRNPKWGRFCGQVLVAGDRKPFQRLLNNMALSKRKSDSIAVTAKVFKPVLAGRALAGEVLAGGVTNT